MDVRFGTWNVRNLYRAGSIMSVENEICLYNSVLVGVDEILSDRGGTKPAGEYIFFYGKGNENHELGTAFFLHKKIISAVKNVCPSPKLFN
jgi:hypothetical protein